MAHDLTGQLVASEIHGFHTLQGTCILLLTLLLRFNFFFFGELPTHFNYGFIYFLGVGFCVEFWHVGSFVIGFAKKNKIELTKSREITPSDVKISEGFMCGAAFVLFIKDFTCKNTTKKHACYSLKCI